MIRRWLTGYIRCMQLMLMVHGKQHLLRLSLQRSGWHNTMSSTVFITHSRCVRWLRGCQCSIDCCQRSCQPHQCVLFLPVLALLCTPSPLALDKLLSAQLSQTCTTTLHLPYSHTACSTIITCPAVVTKYACPATTTIHTHQTHHCNSITSNGHIKWGAC
jgi:hypothetical protein